MFTVKPWSKEIEKIFRQLQKNGRVFHHDVKINRDIGRHCPQLIDKDFLDISPRTYKKNRYWINLMPDTVIEEDVLEGRDRFIKFRFIKKI